MRDWMQMIRAFLDPDGGGGGTGAGTPAAAAAGAPNPGNPAPENPTPGTPAIAGQTPATGGAPANPATIPVTPGVPSQGNPANPNPANPTNPTTALGETPKGTDLERDAQATALAEATAIGAVHKAASQVGQVADPDYLEHLARTARAKNPETFDPAAFVAGVKSDPSKAWLFGQAAPAPGATTTSPPPSGGPGAERAAAQAAYEQAKAKGDVTAMMRLKRQPGFAEPPNVASLRG